MSFSRGASSEKMEEEEKRSLLPKGEPTSRAPTPTETGSRSIESGRYSREEKTDDRTEKQQYLEFAVSSLKTILIIFLCSVILATTCNIVYEVNTSYMPLWVIFFCLWLGHAVIFGISVRVIQLLFRSLIPGFEKDKLTNKVLRTNEKRVALAQFTLFNLLWLHGVSLIAIIFEILLYLSLENITPAYAPLIPLYILASISIVNTLICRTTPYSTGLSWICILIFAILCNLMVDNTAGGLSWVFVCIPIVVLILLWLSIFSYVLVMYSMSIFILQRQQLEACVLYFTATLSTMISVTLLLTGSSETDPMLQKSMMLWGTGIFLFAEILFSIGLIKTTEVSIYMAIERMGSDRPQSLIRSNEGWEVDPKQSFEQYPFIGEIESSRSESKSSDDMWLPFCGCCSSVTVVDLLMGNSNTKSPRNTPVQSRNASREGNLESLA